MSDAGEIIGRLKLDASDWLAKIEEAKGEAESLSKVDPTVRIRTDGAARAVTELEGVRVAEDRVAKSAGGAGESGRNGAAGMGLLWTALADVSLAAPPVAAAAIGLGGAFSVAAGVAVLAVLGISSELKNGGRDAETYRALIGGLKDDLDSLEQTAAHNLLGGMQQSVTLLNSEMPLLNGYTGLFAQSLGRIIPTGLQAVFNTLHNGAPLFLSAEQFLERFVRGIDGFTASNGFQQFIAYAVANLPNVEALIGQVLQFVGRFVAAWAPLGAIALPILTDLIGALNAIPLPVLQLLLVGVLGVTTAVMTWKTLAPIIVAVSAAFDSALGPIGLVIGAVTVAVGVFATLAGGVQDNTAAIQSYTSALEASNGVIDENVRRTVAQQLSQQGLFDDAQRLGLSARTLTDAVLGNADAMGQVKVATDKASASAAGAAQQGLRTAGAAGAAAAAAGNLRNKVLGQNSAFNSGVKAAKDIAAATGGTVGPLNSAASAARNLAGAVDLATTAEYKLESTSDNAVIAIGGMKSALEASAKAARDHHVSLDGDSVAGAQNREAVLSAMAAISKHAQEMRNDGHSAAEAKAYTDKMTASLIDNAVKAGANRNAVAALIAKILGIPKSAAVKITADTAAAEARLLAIRSHMDNLNGLAATVYVNAVANGVSTGQASQQAKNAFTGSGAYGGTAGMSGFGDLPRMASGGSVFGPGTAASDTAGVFRLAAGEEVISNQFGGASNFRPLLKAISAGKVHTRQQAANMLGGSSPEPVTVIVQARDGAPDFTDYIDVRVVQGLSAQQAQGARTVRMGRMDRGLLAGA